MCVHSTVMRQEAEDHDRLVIHLYNDANSTAFHALPDSDVPLREEVLPIHEIEISLRPDFAIQKAHFEPGGQILPILETDHGSTIQVPRLDVHAMVIIELKPGLRQIDNP